MIIDQGFGRPPEEPSIYTPPDVMLLSPVEIFRQWRVGRAFGQLLKINFPPFDLEEHPYPRVLKAGGPEMGYTAQAKDFKDHVAVMISKPLEGYPGGKVTTRLIAFKGPRGKLADYRAIRTERSYQRVRDLETRFEVKDGEITANSFPPEDVLQGLGFALQNFPRRSNWHS